jgi:hypothetical protein
MPAPQNHVDRLARACPGGSVLTQPDGSAVVQVPSVRLPTGWSKAETSVIWVLSPAYPAAQPDCFYTDLDLSLSGGGAPANSGVQVLGDRPLLWFSWHLQSWRPAVDDLVSYLRFIEMRLSDAR